MATLCRFCIFVDQAVPIKTFRLAPSLAGRSGLEIFLDSANKESPMRKICALEYLSMPKPKRAWFKFCSFFLNIPSAIGGFVKSIPSKLWVLLQKIGMWFSTFIDALRYGNFKTKISLLAWGAGCFAYGQIGRGLMFSLYEVAFILYMIFFGWQYLSRIALDKSKLVALNDIKSEYGGTGGKHYDNTFSILLYSLLTIIIILLTLVVIINSVKQAYDNQLSYAIAKRMATTRDDVNQLLNHKFHITILAFPSLTLVVFTVIPLLFMILVAFTDFHQTTMPPANLFTWVGFDNFKAVITGEATSGTLAQNAEKYAHTFWYILRWTLVWAVIATFSNLFGGMFVAILINKKGIRLKKLWRTCLVTVIAVPQFVSLLLVSKMFITDGGIINYLLQFRLGLEPVKWLNGSRTMAQFVIIMVNLWVGVPYTVLTCTGILMNIPSDLYEAAKIDGANPFKMFAKITFPYMMFVLGPSTITAFVSNINNFNIIFLLTNGTGASGQSAAAGLVTSAGDLDLLITWLYRMTVDKSDYDMASVIGILLFVVIAFFSLIAYSRIGSVKNEEDFQ